MRFHAIVLATALAASPALAQSPAMRAMELGVRAFEAGEHAVAQEAFIQAVKADPANGRAWLGLADASRRVGAVADAEEALERAIELVDEDSEMHRGLAMYFAEAEEPERAAQHLAEYVRLLGDEALPEELAQVSRLYLDAGMASAAEQFARSGLERARRAEPLSALGAALARMGRTDEAAQALAEAVEEDPYQEKPHWLRGRLFLEQARYADAERALEQGLRYFDKSPLLHFGMGLARLGAGDGEAAIAALLTAAEHDPAAAWTHLALGRLSALTASPEPVRHVLKAHHRAVGVAPSAGLLASALGPSDEAEALLRAASAASNTGGPAALALGELLERRGEPKAALAAYEQAVKAEPRRPEPRYRMGRLAARLGDAEKATRELALHARLAAQQEPEGLIAEILSAAPGPRLLAGRRQ